MKMEHPNNYKQPQQENIFFKNEYYCHRYKEDDDFYDVYVVFKVLSPNGFETISGQLNQTVQLFWICPIGNDNLKIKMRESLIRNKDIISKDFERFANLDIVKEYKSDILDLKGKCLRLISDFMDGNGENKEMENRKETINNEIKKLHDKMESDENLKGYRVAHQRNLEDIDGYIQYIQKIIEKHKNGEKSEEYHNSSSDENSTETATQSTKEEARKEPLIQRIKNFLSFILNKTK